MILIRDVAKQVAGAGGPDEAVPSCRRVSAAWSDR